jgi:prophage regulatory protein
MHGSGHTNPALKLVTFADLKERGVPYSRDHLRRMTVAGTFPKPIQLGPGRVAWIEGEIADWIEARMAARRAAQPQRRKLIPAG